MIVATPGTSLEDYGKPWGHITKGGWPSVNVLRNLHTSESFSPGAGYPTFCGFRNVGKKWNSHPLAKIARRVGCPLIKLAWRETGTQYITCSALTPGIAPSA